MSHSQSPLPLTIKVSLSVASHRLAAPNQSSRLASPFTVRVSLAAHLSVAAGDMVHHDENTPGRPGCDNNFVLVRNEEKLVRSIACILSFFFFLSISDLLFEAMNSFGCVVFCFYGFFMEELQRGGFC
jgi:hypothetical protein